MKSSFVFFHIVFSLVISVSTYSMEEPPRPKSLGSSRAASSVSELQRESLEALVLSQDLPRLSKEFCDDVISSAPKLLRDQIRLLINPVTRNQVLPDNMLFFGPSGSGKTTLAWVIAQEMNMPFLIVTASMLGNEYANSKTAGLKRIGQLASKEGRNIIVDEVDVFAKENKSNNDKGDSRDESPKALWQLLDTIERKKLLFIGTTNDLSNMPKPLRTRLALGLHEIPPIKDWQNRMKVIRNNLNGKIVDSEQSIHEFCKESYGLSNREIGKIIFFAYKLALSRDQNLATITRDDFKAGLERAQYANKTLDETKWEKKEIFNYTVQTIGAVANLVSIINMIVGMNNSFRSLEIAAQGLKNQVEAMGMQQEGLDYQKKGVGLQEKGVVLQEKGVTLQVKGLGLQEKGLGFQQQGLESQKEALETQQKSLSYQKWSSNPVAFTYASLGKVWGGTKFVGSTVWSGGIWLKQKIW